MDRKDEPPKGHMAHGYEEIYEETITYDEHGHPIRKVRSLKREMTEEEAAQFMKVRNIASIANMAIDLILNPFLERHGLMGPSADGFTDEHRGTIGRVEKIIDAEVVKPAPPPPPPPKAVAPHPPALLPFKLPPLRLPGPRKDGNGKK